MTPRPLLVLVHGTRFDARAWAGYAELVPQADVVAVDLPGHGRRAGQPCTADAALAVVDEVIGGAGGDVPVILAGHSLGGYVAAGYARRHPHRLSGLVLIGAATDPSRHPHLSRLYTGFARALPRIGAARMARLTNAIMRRAGLPADALPGVAGYEVLGAAWSTVLADARAEHLADVRCPVHLVAGQFDQLRLDTGHYARACRDARVCVIARATHLAPFTHAEQVAAILREAVVGATPRGG